MRNGILIEMLLKVGKRAKIRNHSQINLVALNITWLHTPEVNNFNVTCKVTEFYWLFWIFRLV